MKKALLLLAAIVFFALFVVSGCETDQAVTGIRIQNNAGDSIDGVKIVPSGAEAADVLNLLISNNIPIGDYRDFETPVGDYGIYVKFVESEPGAYDFVSNVTVVNGQVKTVSVTSGGPILE